MPSADRAAITRAVYQHLAVPSFHRCLTARAPDGTHPVVVALRGDRVDSLLSKIDINGGTSNVVIPWLNGFVVLAMETAPVTGSRKHELPPAVIKGACTVGVFLERLKVDHVRDGEQAVYRFVVDSGHGHEAEGCAEVVAVGG